MTQIVHTTVINQCTDCPNCILHDPYDGEAGEMEVYCNAVKSETGATFVSPQYSEDDIIPIPKWCPLRQVKK